MKEKQESIISILKRIGKIEKEICEVKKDITELYSPTVIENRKAPVEEIEFTIDDLCEAFGDKHKSYALRLRKALEKEGVTSLRQFLSMTPGQLFDLDGVGPGTLQYANKAFKRIGIKW